MIDLIKFTKFTLNMEHGPMNKTFKFHGRLSIFTKMANKLNLIIVTL